MRARRSAVGDAVSVLGMDPWTDDRVRDFVAVNTIQRLRAYHLPVDAPMPAVDDANAARAVNLLLLPKAEPDYRPCLGVLPPSSIQLPSQPHPLPQRREGEPGRQRRGYRQRGPEGEDAEVDSPTPSNASSPSTSSLQEKGGEADPDGNATGTNATSAEIVETLASSPESPSADGATPVRPRPQASPLVHGVLSHSFYCPVDRARAVFFGESSFTTSTSPRRLLHSPHVPVTPSESSTATIAGRSVTRVPRSPTRLFSSVTISPSGAEATATSPKGEASASTGAQGGHQSAICTVSPLPPPPPFHAVTAVRSLDEDLSAYGAVENTPQRRLQLKEGDSVFESPIDEGPSPSLCEGGDASGLSCAAEGDTSVRLIAAEQRRESEADGGTPAKCIASVAGTLEATLAAAPPPPSERFSRDAVDGTGPSHDFGQSPSACSAHSCDVCDAIIQYYQSLLTRGVVLDRYNHKDLAFAWWVLGCDMDVAALEKSGPRRREALLITIRNFYYTLLSAKEAEDETVTGFAADRDAVEVPDKGAPPTVVGEDAPGGDHLSAAKDDVVSRKRKATLAIRKVVHNEGKLEAKVDGGDAIEAATEGELTVGRSSRTLPRGSAASNSLLTTREPPTGGRRRDDPAEEALAVAQKRRRTEGSPPPMSPLIINSNEGARLEAEVRRRLGSESIEEANEKAESAEGDAEVHDKASLASLEMASRSVSVAASTDAAARGKRPRRRAADRNRAVEETWTSIRTGRRAAAIKAAAQLELGATGESVALERFATTTARVRHSPSVEKERPLTEPSSLATGTSKAIVRVAAEASQRSRTAVRSQPKQTVNLKSAQGDKSGRERSSSSTSSAPPDQKKEENSSPPSAEEEGVGKRQQNAAAVVKKSQYPGGAARTTAKLGFSSTAAKLPLTKGRLSSSSDAKPLRKEEAVPRSPQPAGVAAALQASKTASAVQKTLTTASSSSASNSTPPEELRGRRRGGAKVPRHETAAETGMKDNAPAAVSTASLRSSHSKRGATSALTSAGESSATASDAAPSATAESSARASASPMVSPNAIEGATRSTFAVRSLPLHLTAHAKAVRSRIQKRMGVPLQSSRVLRRAAPPSLQPTAPHDLTNTAVPNAPQASCVYSSYTFLLSAFRTATPDVLNSGVKGHHHRHGDDNACATAITAPVIWYGPVAAAVAEDTEDAGSLPIPRQTQNASKIRTGSSHSSPSFSAANGGRCSKRVSSLSSALATAASTCARHRGRKRKLEGGVDPCLLGNVFRHDQSALESLVKGRIAHGDVVGSTAETSEKGTKVIEGESGMPCADSQVACHSTWRTGHLKKEPRSERSSDDSDDDQTNENRRTPDLRNPDEIGTATMTLVDATAPDPAENNFSASPFSVPTHTTPNASPAAVPSSAMHDGRVMQEYSTLVCDATPSYSTAFEDLPYAQQCLLVWTAVGLLERHAHQRQIAEARRARVLERYRRMATRRMTAQVAAAEQDNMADGLQAGLTGMADDATSFTDGSRSADDAGEETDETSDADAEVAAEGDGGPHHQTDHHPGGRTARGDAVSEESDATDASPSSAASTSSSADVSRAAVQPPPRRLYDYWAAYRPAGR